jgi:ABC-2 type transport system ATP-binding protein
MIQINNLNKNFTVTVKEPGLKGSIKSLFKRETIQKQALSNINLTINDDEIIGLIGPNGAGKTTLTKILSGIIHPTSGEVTVLGHIPWERDNSYRRQMSLIMGQKAQLWWDLPALDGFLLLKEIYQIPQKQFQESIDYLSDCLQIKDQLKVTIRKLSLGERMKVELMAALLHRPKVIFLDEPTIGLDLAAQEAVRKFIKSYRQEFKPIMILTSHYMQDIESLCERIVMLQHGEIIYDGSIKHVMDKYAQTKILAAHAPEQNIEMALKSFPSELGQLQIKGERIIIETPKNKIMEASQFLMQNLTLSDLTISEQEIGPIIQSMLDNNGKH